MEKVEHLKVCLTTDENDRKLNNNEISCKDVLKREGTRETVQIVRSWIWKKRWSIMMATFLLFICGGMVIPFIVSHYSVSQGQIEHTAVSLSGKLEDKILMLSVQNQLVELQKQHQEDINRLEIHLTERKTITGLTNKTNTNGVSIEQLQTSNLQLSKKIEVLEETQKQKEILRTTINRLEQDILRNTNKIEEMAREKTQTQGNTENSQHRPASSGQSSLKPPEFLFWIAFLYITSLLVGQMMKTNK